MYEYIEFIICYGEQLKPEVVYAKTRKQEIVFARQLIMFFANKYKIGTLAKTGELAGGKDHATVMHSVKQINNYLETDKVKKTKIEYYDMLLEKVLTLKRQKDEIKDLMKPLEKEISDLEQRCLNLTLQVAFLKDKMTPAKDVALTKVG